SPNSRSSLVTRTLLAAALAATTTIAVPIIARSGQDAGIQPAQLAQADEPQGGEEHGGGPGHWMRGEGGPGMHGWRGMMMDRMVVARDPEERCGERLAGGPGHWMRGEDGPGMHGWRGMMMHRMMVHRDPKERCGERLAWRAAMRAYTEAKLDLTPEQRPLWDKVQSIAQTEQQKERQLCAA